jgi:hypothetical protein
MLGPNGKAAAMQVHAAGAKRVDIMKSSICPSLRSNLANESYGKRQTQCGKDRLGKRTMYKSLVW